MNARQDSSLRIGIVCPYDWQIPGGVKAHINDLALTLIKRGHEVSVLAPSPDDAPDLPDFVVPAGKSVAIRYNGSVARLRFGLSTTRRVQKWLRQGRFDVVHVHEPAAPSVSLISVWATDGPIVGTFHTSNPRSRAMSAGSGMLQTALEKINGRIAVSQHARDTLVSHVGGDAVIIPNGVRCAEFAHAPELPADSALLQVPEGRQLLFLGRIDEPRKGLQVLLAAWPAIAKAHPDVQLVVAGPGDESQVKSLLPVGEPGGRIHFLGLVSDDEKVAAFHRASCYIAPNTGGESFGIILLEAMAAGAPVVASDITAFARVLDGGTAGVLFRNEDAASLAKHTNELLSQSEKLVQLRQRGLERAAEFDWERITDDIVHVYESVRVPGQVVQPNLTGQVLGRMVGS